MIEFQSFSRRTGNYDFYGFSCRRDRSCRHRIFSLIRTFFRAFPSKFPIDFFQSWGSLGTNRQLIYILLIALLMSFANKFCVYEAAAVPTKEKPTTGCSVIIHIIACFDTLWNHPRNALLKIFEETWLLQFEFVWLKTYFMVLPGW